MTSFGELETPLGPLQCAPGHPAGLAGGLLDGTVDCQEHSLEMQFPFIKYVEKARKKGPIQVTPCLIGHPTTRQMIQYGKAIARGLLEDESAVLVISSDFCHWGHGYNYIPDMSPYAGPEAPELWQQIQAMDQQAHQCISQGYDQFDAYLEQTGNTICGQFPIRIALRVVEELGASGRQGKWIWLHYEQSSNITDRRGSSVSYTAAVYSV